MTAPLPEQATHLPLTLHEAIAGSANDLMAKLDDIGGEHAATLAFALGAFRGDILKAVGDHVAAIRAEAAGSEMHELVFTDREARPAKWETRCGRTDVPLERAGSADPGMHYPVTCKACIRIAELERLADEMLAAFEGREPWTHPDDSGRAMVRSRSVDAARYTRWLQVRHSGEAAIAAADELSRLGEELQGGDAR